LDWKEIKKPIDLQNKLKLSLHECINLVEKHLKDQIYEIDDICSILETSKDELISNCLNGNISSCVCFDLYKRAIHVFSEAQRVYDFVEACKAIPLKAFKLLGNLMNESHQSCTKMYDCSCKELDELVQICLDAGAYGSRLTGLI
jgi:N-acetylgalactosamine kinase